MSDEECLTVYFGGIISRAGRFSGAYAFVDCEHAPQDALKELGRGETTLDFQNFFQAMQFGAYLQAKTGCRVIPDFDTLPRNRSAVLTTDEIEVCKRLLELDWRLMKAASALNLETRVSDCAFSRRIHLDARVYNGQ